MIFVTIVPWFESFDKRERSLAGPVTVLRWWADVIFILPGRGANKETLRRWRGNFRKSLCAKVMWAEGILLLEGLQRGMVTFFDREKGKGGKKDVVGEH
jgi:hypothetical protein